ncbi:PIN domain-containing protein [Halorubrum sp. Atlit-28R]|uniref:PIN domain-containing protein n=1 Tax=Halorubrum sp. Atlit-28R TaxID=2282129 RepID=UPI000EF23855|nr:PIN domain-containing protein [Halorubrum sp. Atlit-28R]RLM50931.1 type II toxin-antitoxin system VapC family toxin [Halorubrum sp. Atlit-28R]
MTLYDSSVLIDYLAGRSSAVEYVESHADERAVAPPLVLFEVYQGEVFKSGATDLGAVDEALDWIDVIDTSAAVAREAAVLQDALRDRGDPLAARDAFIAGAAVAQDERLAVSDTDFNVDGIRDAPDFDFV